MPGFPVLSVDTGIQLGNMVTTLLAANHRPTMLRPFTAQILESWLRNSILATDETDFDNLAKMIKGGEDTNKKFNSPIQIFLQGYSDQAAALMCKPRYVADVSEFLRQTLCATPYWDRTFVSTVSLGYPREVQLWQPSMRMSTIPLGMPVFPGTQKQATGVGANSEADATTPPLDAALRWGLATTAAILDIPSLSESLVPEAKSLTQRHEKEPYWGTARVAMQQLNRLTAVGLLWMRQADAYALRRQMTLWDKMYELAYAFYPRERPILELAKALRDFVLSSIPVAPWIETLTNLNHGVSISTVYGEHPLVIRDKTDVLQDIEGREVPLAQVFLAMAMTDYNKLRELSAAGVSWPETLLGTMLPMVDPKVTDTLLTLPPGAQTIGSLAQWLSINQRYVEEWPEIARALGWSGAVAPATYTIDQMGADFVLCDGDNYSDHPFGVLSGLRPAFSVGNHKVLGFARRISTDFNTGNDIDESIDAGNGNGGDPTAMRVAWSTLVLRGHITASARDLALSRYYIPEGMWMGEEGGETRYAGPNCRDNIGQAVLTMYQSRSPLGYVRRGYRDPADMHSRVTPSLTYLRTDWDVWTYGDEESVVQKALLSGYGKRNVEGNDSNTIEVFLWRQEGWNIRVPVQMAREYDVTWYDELGSKAEVLRFEGFVVFDDTLSLMSEKSSLDAVAELVKVQPPKLEPKLSEEATSPEVPGDQ
jgi:hypothetical protein